MGPAERRRHAGEWYNDGVPATIANVLGRPEMKLVIHRCACARGPIPRVQLNAHNYRYKRAHMLKPDEVHGGTEECGPSVGLQVRDLECGVGERQSQSPAVLQVSRSLLFPRHRPCGPRSLQRLRADSALCEDCGRARGSGRAPETGTREKKSQVCRQDTQHSLQRFRLRSGRYLLTVHNNYSAISYCYSSSLLGRALLLIHCW